MLAAENSRKFIYSILNSKYIQNPSQLIGNEEFNIWDLLIESSKILLDIKCQDESYFYLLSLGYDKLKTLVSKPLISKVIIGICKCSIDRYLQVLFKDANKRNSDGIDWELILQFPKVVFK